MPKIKSSAELRNSYSEISRECHESGEPIFITKNGAGDLAVMSIETYDRLMSKYELYGLLQEGIDDIEAGKAEDFDAFMERLNKELEES